jgi:hypothetical protein
VIAYNMIRDGAAGRASYEVDLPNGGIATLIGNVIAQSSQTENPVLVSYGEEGNPWDRNVLRLSHNTLISEGWKPGWFLRVAGDQVPNVETVAVNNLLVGLGVFSLTNSGDFRGNWPATAGMLRDGATLAYELAPSSWLRGRGADLRAIGEGVLVPTAEFERPIGTVELPAGHKGWSPGAYQR